MKLPISWLNEYVKVDDLKEPFWTAFHDFPH